MTTSALDQDALGTGSPLRNLERICVPLRDRASQLAQHVREACGPAALALAVVGDALTEAGDLTRRGGIESVLVLQRSDLPQLRKLAERGFKLGRSGLAAPLVLTSAEINASRDTYPLELLEIQQLHATLFGQEFFDDLSFEPLHVRLQCERELRRARIGLRQGMLAAAGRVRLVAGMEQEAVKTLLRTLRGLLWLRGRTGFLPSAEVVADVGKSAGRELAGIRSALQAPSDAGWTEFDRMYEDVEALGELVNAW